MRFLLDSATGDVVEWDPHDPPDGLPDDVVYWSEAFRELPRDRSLTLVLTWSIRRLPIDSGGDVVAVVLGDEGARRPAYAPELGALFKSYGDRPRFTRFRPGRLGLSIFLQELRRSAEAIRDPRAGPPAYPIPLGLPRPLNVDVRAMDARDIPVAFMGSVEEDHRSIPRAKTLSRRAMLDSLPPTARVRTTGSFGASIREDAAEYADELGRTRVLVAPRGGSVETFRFAEGMLGGCVVVTEPLPDFWFYSGSPAIVVRDWRELPKVLDQILDAPAEQQRLQHLGLRWWRERLSPAAIGRYIAARLP